MKKLTFIIVILLTSSFVSGEKTFCQGWQTGYIEGFCYRDFNCIKPIPPVCPLPEINFNTYKDGYNDGFLQGKKKRKSEDS